MINNIVSWFYMNLSHAYELDLNTYIFVAKDGSLIIHSTYKNVNDIARYIINTVNQFKNTSIHYNPINYWTDFWLIKINNQKIIIKELD